MAGENRILRHCRQAPAGSAARERRQDMSEKADRFRDYDITTRAVHTGNDYDKETARTFLEIIGLSHPAVSDQAKKCADGQPY